MEIKASCMKLPDCKDQMHQKECAIELKKAYPDAYIVVGPTKFFIDKEYVMNLRVGRD